MNNEVEIIRSSGLFDEEWYIEEYQDVKILQMDPITHYVHFGAVLYRDPYPDFDTRNYLKANPDADLKKMTPLYHFIHNNKHKSKEPIRRNTPNLDEQKGNILRSGLFERDWYKQKYKSILKSWEDPLNHYIVYGNRISTYPCPTFNTQYYLGQFSTKLEENALSHYHRIGWLEGKKPNEYFDNDHYINCVPKEELNGMSPLKHYLEQGEPWLYDPSKEFSNIHYLNENSDVRDAGLNPLAHYLANGRLEGRRCFPVRYTESFQYYRIEKNTIICPEDDILLYVAYSPEGYISNFHESSIRYYSELGYKVILIVNSGDYLNKNPVASIHSAMIIVRENLGFDFGAWGHICYLFPALENANSVTFTNDSIIPVIQGKSENVRTIIHEDNSDVIFLTRNFEVEEHYQTYFFTFKKGALRKGCLGAIIPKTLYTNIHQVIRDLEIKLHIKLKNYGVRVKHIYSVIKAESEIKNPTIYFWDYLLEIGFPYLKCKLFTEGFLDFTDTRIKNILSSRQLEEINEHLSVRYGYCTVSMIEEANTVPTQAINKSVLIGPIGELQAFNPPRSQWHPLKIPFDGIQSIAQPLTNKQEVLVIIHCHYIDVAKTIFSLLDNLGLKMRLLCTTDTDLKKQQIKELFDYYHLNGHCVIVKNRGRDVAPFLIEGKKYLRDAEIILHLHTKRSPHNELYQSWGPYLFENLIGSRDIVLSILSLLNERDVGVVYPDHLPAIRKQLNWGFDFDHAKNVLNRIGVNITADMLLEFPSGTMFWAKTEALRPLFDLKIDYDDFEEENGQTDGTLAHAIERCILYVAEHKGFHGLKVISEKNSNKAKDFVTISAGNIKHALHPKPPQLLGSFGRVGHHSTNYDTYPVQVCKSSNIQKRFNILIPTMDRKKIFGGISTALNIGKKILQGLNPPVDLRLIVTSDKCDYESLIECKNRVDSNIFRCEPYDDSHGSSIVDLFGSRYVPLSLRKNDIFFATAWWTADLGFRLQSRQKQIFKSSPKLIYLIQDYECGFYNWSPQYTECQATYSRPQQTIPIFNSEELANFMSHHFKFDQSFILPFKLNETLKENIASSKKEPIILVYGRPGTPRNLFKTIVEGLRIWQSTSPVINTKYRIKFVGEKFNGNHISQLENVEICGKLSLKAYADLLNKAAIGISLMESPHPSYPPLEMASAGCITITNKYDFKDLSKRAPNIISLDLATPDALSAALNEAIKRVNFKVLTPTTTIQDIPTDIQPFDVESIIQNLY